MRTDTLLTLNCCLMALFGVGLAVALLILETPGWITTTIATVVGTTCGITSAHLWDGRAK